MMLAEIKTSVMNKEKFLPPETSLAEKWGVSRTLIRDCSATFEREGYISRRQGIGTQINPHVLDIPLRMDFEIEFNDRVRAMGLEPETKIIDVTIIASSELIAKKLLIGVNTPILRIAKLVRASGKAAIYCIDHISFQTIKKYNYTSASFEEPIFAFLKDFCDTDVYMDLTEVSAVIADQILSETLEVAIDSPLLNMNELGYNLDGDPILWSNEYYVPNVISYTVIRKRP